MKNLIEITRSVLNAGIDLNVVNIFEKSPIYIAIQNRNVDMVELLLSFHPNLNILYRNGESLLHLSAQMGSLEILTKLIAHGMDINKQNNRFYYIGTTTLHFILLQQQAI